MKEVYIKDGFWVGDFVLLEVVIEISIRSFRIYREKWLLFLYRIDYFVLVKIYIYIVSIVVRKLRLCDREIYIILNK